MKKQATALITLTLCSILIGGCDNNASSTEDAVILTDATSTETTAAATETTETTTKSETTTTRSETTTSAESTTTAESETTTETVTTQTQETTATETSATTAETISAKWYEELTFGSDCSAYFKTHKDYTMQESASCLGDGKDRTYQFDGYEIYTYFDGTNDLLSEVDLLAAGIPNKEGAEVGMTKAQITEIYGKDSDTMETSNGTTTQFTYAGDNVSMIAVYTNLEV